MKKILFCLMLVSGVLCSIPAWAGFFSSCDAGSNSPKPDWVSQTYSLPGYVVGLGSAEKDGKSRDEQAKVAESNAKSNLVQQIGVTIRAENELSTRVSNDKVQKDASSRVTEIAEEELHGLQTKEHWVDKENCTYYSLATISEKSVLQAKREKIMRNRLYKFKGLLAEGMERDKNRDITVRRKYLENAQALLADTDFSVLPEELGKEIYVKTLNEALAMLNKEAAQTKGRLALFAINRDGGLHADVIGKMLDQLRSGDSTADRLISDCTQEQECIGIAKERGFTLLAVLKANTQIGTSAMGSLKGTLTVSRTVYDIGNGKVVRGPDTASAQVIGWSNEELDWNSAAEKAMEGLK